jgi:hypothetical protein
LSSRETGDRRTGVVEGIEGALRGTPDTAWQELRVVPGEHCGGVWLRPEAGPQLHCGDLLVRA